jgi:hypothetical protein
MPKKLAKNYFEGKYFIIPFKQVLWVHYPQAGVAEVVVFVLPSGDVRQLTLHAGEVGQFKKGYTAWLDAKEEVVGHE